MQIGRTREELGHVRDAAKSSNVAVASLFRYETGQNRTRFCRGVNQEQSPDFVATLRRPVRGLEDCIVFFTDTRP